MEDVADIAIYKQCLRATAYGPFFDEWEFDAVLAFDREEFRAIADSYEESMSASGEIGQAIETSMGSLLLYGHDKNARWHDWISIDGDQLARVLKRWRSRHSGA